MWLVGAPAVEGKTDKAIANSSRELLLAYSRPGAKEATARAAPDHAIRAAERMGWPETNKLPFMENFAEKLVGKQEANRKE